MSDPDEQMDFLESRIPELSAAATKVAYWNALASGRSILEAKDGVLCERFPDGTRREVRQLPAGHRMAIGTRFEIP